jgi:hypothetical protein
MAEILSRYGGYTPPILGTGGSDVDRYIIIRKILNNSSVCIVTG